jgi:hypothetical protein
VGEPGWRTGGGKRLAKFVERHPYPPHGAATEARDAASR